MLNAYEQSLMVEGWTSLFAGFNVYFVRTYMYAAITMFTMDQLTHNWKIKAGLKAEQM